MPLEIPNKTDEYIKHILTTIVSKYINLFFPSILSIATYHISFPARFGEIFPSFYFFPLITSFKKRFL